MTSVIIVAIVFGSLLTFVAIVCGTILAIVRSRRGLGNSSGSQSEEAQMIQEIYQGLSRMEERIETLETILMESKNR